MARKRKKYLSEERYIYHKSREFNLAKYGLRFGGPKHLYSAGFTDGFYGIDNKRATRAEFGKKIGYAYNKGHMRGSQAADEYIRRTGNSPRDVKYK